MSQKISFHTSTTSFVCATTIALPRATMRFYFINAVLGTLAIPALAITLPRASHISHVVHEKRDTILKKWVQCNCLDPDHVLRTRMGLKQSDLHLGMDYLMEM